MWPQPRNGIVCFLAFLSRKANPPPFPPINDVDDDDAGAELELWLKDVDNSNNNNSERTTTNRNKLYARKILMSTARSQFQC